MQNTFETYLNLTLDQIFQKLQSSQQGLTDLLAKQRLRLFGYNEFAKTQKRSIIVESLSHAVNPLVGILLIAALISGLTGSVTNAVIIIFMVILSVIIDYYQSHRSLRAMEQLKSQVAATATVLRDNVWLDIFAKEIVPGDIIKLTAGDLVPADALLITAKDLHVQQAALTGESLPVEKEISSTPITSTDITAAENMVFAGSSIVSGIATALVITTGQNTEFGQIAKNLAIRPPRTEFEKGMIRFGLFISKTILFLVLFVFIISIYLKRDLLESLLFAIALAVGLTPEFLPMITTVTLATGAERMSRNKVIVKNLASMQNFGSMDILCSDKTGTLTTGEMTLEQYVDPTNAESDNVLLLAYLNSLYQSGIKNPIDEAVLRHTNLNPLDIAILNHNHPDVQPYLKIDEIPFDFERKRSSVVVDKSGEHILITKGAPENILEICSSYDLGGKSFTMDQTMHNKCTELFQSLCAQGFRLLAVAYRNIIPQQSYHVIDEVNLTFAGFLVFSDPPLPDAAEVINDLHLKGVNVKILTGDNELVAKHICQKVGINIDKIILGSDLDHMTNDALAQVAEQTMLFARVAPAQKQRIIAALRSRSHVIGYIGDGINDAPSLHTSDVGISVAGAVDVAKEAADIILLERSLKVLLNGIIEGRKSFGNVMKYLMMGTSSNFGNVFSMAFAIVFLPFLPMLPTQILLNNLLYDISQLTIPTDKVDNQFTDRPRVWDIDIIRKFMIYIGPISSIFDFLTFFVMIKIFAASEPMFQTGWFVESLATQTLVIFIIRTAGNPFKSRPSMPLVISVLLVVAIGMLLPFIPIGHLFGFVPLPLDYFVFLVLCCLTYLLLVQVVKEKLMWRWIR